MAEDQSQDYPFILNPKTDRRTLSQFVAIRSQQIEHVSSIGKILELNAVTRETLHSIVLELGIQQRMLKGGAL